MHFDLYRSHGEWRWTLIAGNGEKIANSGESYHNRGDALAAIRIVKISLFARVREKAPMATVKRKRAK